MTVNWNKLIPLILLAAVGVGLLIAGALMDSSEMLVAGTGAVTAAVSLAVNYNAITTALVLLCALSGSALMGCGASSEEVRETACTATRLACQACSVAEDRYCGGEHVETESDPKPCDSGGEEPDIDRVYPAPSGGET